MKVTTYLLLVASSFIAAQAKEHYVVNEDTKDDNIMVGATKECK